MKRTARTAAAAKKVSDDGYAYRESHSDRGESDREDGPPAAEDPRKRLASFRTRTASTLLMILGFALIVYLGHVPLVALVFTLQFLMVKELFHLARVAQKDNSLPGFRAQQWYFFAVAAFYLYVRFIKANLLIEIATGPSGGGGQALSWVLKRHNIISYLLYMGGFISFVLSLRRGMYMYQFGQYAWTHMILLTVFVPSSFLVSNIFEGLIWFLLPSALIIVNDIMAYLAGFFFGRTPLIRLSPKKTWEGFAGGVVGTVAAGYLLAALLSRSAWMTCPRRDLSIGPLVCEPDEVFRPALFNPEELLKWLAPPIAGAARLVFAVLPAPARAALSGWSFVARPMQVHAAVMAVFASFVAPFGGFFASGFKRAFRMKDFGDTIPGHGGVTDRFDCQMVMAMFAYLYYWTFVARAAPSVGAVLEAAEQLPAGQQLELLALLASLLLGGGALPAEAAPHVRALLQAVSGLAAAAAGGGGSGGSGGSSGIGISTSISGSSGNNIGSGSTPSLLAAAATPPPPIEL